MKRIYITYHMSRDSESAENCIATTLSDEIADALLDGEPPALMELWLNDLAIMQGYDRAGFVKAGVLLRDGYPRRC